MVSAVWSTLRSNGLAEEDGLTEEEWLVDVAEEFSEQVPDYWSSITLF